MIQILLILFTTLSTLYGHQTGLSYIEMQQRDGATLEVLYKKPLADINAEDIVINFPTSCLKNSSVHQKIENGFISKRFTLECSSSLMGQRVWVEGLVRSDRGVVAIYKEGEYLQQALLRASTPFISIEKDASRLSVMREYAELGVVHILLGYDHLMFVFLLVLLATSMRTLLYAITAFTLSHSLTLASAILGVVSISITYVEAMIALSIVFLAREMLVANEATLTKKYLALVAFLFGLLHGFGFSSVLSSIGLPQDEVPLALLSFNAGIEIGQLLFVGVVLLALRVVKKYFASYEESILRVILYAVGITASFWFLQRSLGTCL